MGFKKRSDAKVVGKVIDYKDLKGEAEDSKKKDKKEKKN